MDHNCLTTNPPKNTRPFARYIYVFYSLAGNKELQTAFPKNNNM